MTPFEVYVMIFTGCFVVGALCALTWQRCRRDRDTGNDDGGQDSTYPSTMWNQSTSVFLAVLVGWAGLVLGIWAVQITTELRRERARSEQLRLERLRQEELLAQQEEARQDHYAQRDRREDPGLRPQGSP